MLTDKQKHTLETTSMMTASVSVSYREYLKYSKKKTTKKKPSKKTEQGWFVW